MEESEGRFNRVYTDLKGRIISGQFPAGSSFLSAEQLRQEYQIGFHTARNVTARLREEGVYCLQKPKGASGLLGRQRAFHPFSRL